MAISLRLKEGEEKYIREYAKANHLSVSALIRKTMLEKIEDELDLKAFNEAKMDFLINPVSYTHKEVCEKFDIVL